jgi:hypothetical protein
MPLGQLTSCRFSSLRIGTAPRCFPSVFRQPLRGAGFVPIQLDVDQVVRDQRSGLTRPVECAITQHVHYT